MLGPPRPKHEVAAIRAAHKAVLQLSKARERQHAKHAEQARRLAATQAAQVAELDSKIEAAKKFVEELRGDIPDPVFVEV